MTRNPIIKTVPKPRLRAHNQPMTHASTQPSQRIPNVTPDTFTVKRSGRGMKNAWATLVAVRNLDPSFVVETSVAHTRSCWKCRTGQARCPGVQGMEHGAILYAAVFDDPHEDKWLSDNVSLLTSFYSGDDAMAAGSGHYWICRTGGYG